MLTVQGDHSGNVTLVVSRCTDSSLDHLTKHCLSLSPGSHLSRLSLGAEGFSLLIGVQEAHHELDGCVQILQWVFAGAPGHPALREICDRIARTILEPIDEDTNLDTLERTGPGLWTDIVLKHARLHPIAKVAFTLALPSIAILWSHCH